MEDISKIFREALKIVFDDGEWGVKSQVAKIAGLAPPQLHDIESGRRFGSEEQRRAIAAALGYPGYAYETFLDIGRKKLGLPLKNQMEEKEVKEAKNSVNYPVRNILNDLLAVRSLSRAEISKKTGIAIPSLEKILNGERLPSFIELEALYNKFKINPVVFFMHPKNPKADNVANFVDDQLLNILNAARELKRNEPPNEAHLQNVFDLKPKDAAKIFNEWGKTPLNSGRTYLLSQELLNNLAKKYEIDPESIYYGRLLLQEKGYQAQAETKALPPAPEYQRVIDIILSLDQAQLAALESMLLVFGKFPQTGAGLNDKGLAKKRGKKKQAQSLRSIDTGGNVAPTDASPQKPIIKEDKGAGVNGGNKK